MKYNQKDKFDRLPDVILIDIDNTLYPYKPAHTAAHEAVRSKATRMFSIQTEDFEQAFKEARQEIKKQLGEIAASHSRLLYFKRMLEILGIGSQVLTALDFEQTYWRSFLKAAVLFDDVIETLNDLRLYGIQVALLTDLTAQIQLRKVIYFGLDDYVDFIITSEEAGTNKCHGLPYQLALERIAPKGERIWMIGDDPVNDIAAARRTIGAVTIQKLHDGLEPGTGEQEPDATYQTFSELRSKIAELANLQETA